MGESETSTVDLRVVVFRPEAERGDAPLKTIPRDLENPGRPRARDDIEGPADAQRNRRVREPAVPQTPLGVKWWRKIWR